MVANPSTIRVQDFFDSSKRAIASVEPEQIFRRIYFGVWGFGADLTRVEMKLVLSFLRLGKRIREDVFGYWSGYGDPQIVKGLVKAPFTVTERTGAVPGNPMPITAGEAGDELTMIDTLDNGSGSVMEARLRPYRTAERCDAIQLDAFARITSPSEGQFRVFVGVHSSRENV